MFGLVLVSDGQNEGPLNNGSDIYCSACSPLVWDNLGLFHLVAAVGFCCQFAGSARQRGDKRG